jgi:hypothetical protein
VSDSTYTVIGPVIKRVTRPINRPPKKPKKTRPPVVEEGSNDPNIVWDSTPLTSTVVEASSTAYNNLYFYEGSNGKVQAPFHSSVGYWIDADTLGFGDVIHDDATAFNTGEYLVKYEVVSVLSGSAAITLNYTPGQEGVWVDLFRANIEIDDTVADGTEQHVVIDVTVATDDGAGSPVAGSESTKRVTMYAERLA